VPLANSVASAHERTVLPPGEDRLGETLASAPGRGPPALDRGLSVSSGRNPSLCARLQTTDTRPWIVRSLGAASWVACRSQENLRISPPRWGPSREEDSGVVSKFRCLCARADRPTTRCGVLGGLLIPRKTLGSLLPNGVSLGSKIQVLLANSVASAHARTIRPPGATSWVACRSQEKS
jgi:hypothetical protein